MTALLWNIGGRSLRSRLLLGTARYPSLAVLQQAIGASGAEIRPWLVCASATTVRCSSAWRWGGRMAARRGRFQSARQRSSRQTTQAGTGSADVQPSGTSGAA